jgi:hypothetical protein
VSQPSLAGPATYDNESTNHKQQRQPLSDSTALHTKLGQSFPISHRELNCSSRAQLVPADCAAFEPGQASALDNSSVDAAIPETNDASLAGDKTTRHGHALEHDTRPSRSSCKTMSSRDGSICLPNDEWDKRFPFSHQAVLSRRRARHAVKNARDAVQPDQPQSVLSPCQAASSHGGQKGTQLQTRLHGESIDQDSLRDEQLKI